MKKFLIPSAVFFTFIIPTAFLFAQTVTLTNPLSAQYSSIPSLLGALLNVVEYIGAIACGLWIIWAGFSFVKARGNSEELSKAKTAFLHAVIGTLIILGAGAILQVITNIITTIKPS